MTTYRNSQNSSHMASKKLWTAAPIDSKSTSPLFGLVKPPDDDDCDDDDDDDDDDGLSTTGE